MFLPYFKPPSCAFFLTLLVFLTLSTTVNALGRFDTWTIGDGLPQNSVYAILQTRDGYLWFTTLNGLVRYDGGGFTVFDKNNSNGITSNRFTTLYEDYEGSLWVGSEGDGVTRLKGGIFTTYISEGNSAYNRINSIAGGKDGNLWVLTEGGMAQWKDEAFTPYLNEGQPYLSIETKPNPLLKDIVRNSGAAMTDDDGLHVVRDGSFSTLSIADGLSSLKINSLYQDGGGDLWIGTEGSGVNRLVDGKLSVFTTSDGLPSNGMVITAATEDRKGTIWFAMFRSPGLYRMEAGKLRHFTTADGLSGNQVQSIFEDREGNIWIGTIDGGINRFKDEVITTYSKNDGLFSDNAYAIYEDSRGSIWVGTQPGLNRYEDGKFSRGYTKADGLTSQMITSIYEDREGNLWVGAYGGIDRFKDGRFTPLEGFPREDFGAVLAIHQDPSGAIWFGTLKGLFKYQNSKLEHYSTEHGLPHPQVIALVGDDEGGMWIGTRGGLARLQNGQIHPYANDTGLSNVHIRSIHKDPHGSLWIGTYDSGLFRYFDGRSVQYTTREGLFDNGVFQILDDGQGNFWMSANRGIYRVRRQELEDFAAGHVRSITSIGYGTNDGMLNAECNGGSQPAGARMRDGRMWFPTQQGVAVIDPKIIRTNPLPPPVVIQVVTLDDRDADFSGGPVTLRPGEERFEIAYSGLSFVKPNQVRFKYILEGLDDEWVDAGGRRTANYSYVPPGSYTFRVIAANSDNIWNEQGATLSIIVEPPFWRTNWFLFLATICAASLLITVYRLRIAQLNRARMAQESFSRQLLDSQEHERQRIAGELHDGLGQSLLIIKNRVFLAISSLNDKETAEEQLDEISSTASHAIDEVREIAHNLRPYKLDRFGLTKTLEAILIQASRSSPINFTSSIQNVDDLFPKQAETSIFRIVQEATNNIIKHSQATEARLAIRVEGAEMLLTVKDNGRGLQKIVSENNPTSDQGGFGLIGMSERVRMIGGTFTISSSSNGGTDIDIRLNVPENKRT